MAEEAGLNLQGVEIVSVEHSHAAAEVAAAMAARREVEIIMKGSLHTDEPLKAVLGLRPRCARAAACRTCSASMCRCTTSRC